MKLRICHPSFDLTAEHAEPGDAERRPRQQLRPPAHRLLPRQPGEAGQKGGHRTEAELETLNNFCPSRFSQVCLDFYFLQNANLFLECSV